MGRISAHLVMVGGKSPRQRIWDEIRAQRDGFTPHKLGRAIAKSGPIIQIDQITVYVQSLSKAGFIEAIPSDSKIVDDTECKLVRDNGIEAPRVRKDGSAVTTGLGTEAMWRTMRLLSDFNATELAAHASAGSENVLVTTAKSYIRYLVMAEYLEIAKPSRALGKGRGAIQARYRLAPGKNTGPRPLMIQRTKAVYDPNLGKIVWQEEERDEY